MAAIIVRTPPEITGIIGVRDDKSLCRAIVFRFRQRVGEAETESPREATLDTNLKTVVHRVRIVVGYADDVVALVRTKGVSIDSRVGLERTDRQLIDVALALSMKSAATYVAHFEFRREADLLLICCVPGPGFRVLEDLILRCDLVREYVPRSPARVIHNTIGYGNRRLERWVSTKEYGVTYPESRQEATDAGANHAPVIERVGNTHTGLEGTPFVNFRE